MSYGLSVHNFVPRFALPVLVIALAVLFLLPHDEASRRDRGAEPSPGAPRVGDVAPAFAAQSLTSRRVDFPDGYRGKLVLLDFWATWCPPCRGEIPHLVRAYERFHARGLEIVGITLDQGQVSAPYVSNFAREKHMPWEQIYDDAPQIAADYNVLSIPAAFLVDGDTGRVLAGGDALAGEGLLDTVAEHLATRAGRIPSSARGRSP